MQTGLLWFDSEPSRSTVVKATAAAERYEEKYGVVPDVCYVNERSLQDGEVSIPFRQGRLRLVPARNMLANHFWIGQNDG